MRFSFLKFFLLLIICGSLCLPAFSQPGGKDNVNFELGVQHFQKEEFEQAIHYFQKLYNDSPRHEYYEYLFKSYISFQDYGKAEKLAKKQARNYPKSAEYIFDLGYLYTITNERDNANEQFEKAINTVAEQQHAISDLANRFMLIDELEFAELTYIKGKKKVKDYPFNFELAQVYLQKQDYSAMINEYLDILEINEGYTQSVQNALQNALNPDPEDKKKELLRTELLRRIQKNANSAVYSEMLIWLYVQEKDFAGALVQAKALDKRNNESGNRVMALAKLAQSNKNYDVAIQCYEYVIAKGPENFRYMQAKQELVEIYNEKIINSLYSKTDLEELENLYKTTLKELGENKSTLRLMKGLGHLQAFYLDKADSAIMLLEKAINLPQVSPQEVAECKIELGDIYLISDRIWDASLLYSQVEKAFKYDQTGEIAKFRNARVFYYSGDFNWAKGQLDVLKGSTSKLIANDAMELSLLISDNTTLDTLKLPLYKFAHADLLVLQNKLEEAFSLLDSIEYLFPGHSLRDEILFKKYQIYYKKRDFTHAAEQLDKIYQLDPQDILADNSLFLLAQLNELQFNDKEKAMELYKKLMTDHQDSIYVAEARRRFRALRGDSLN